MLSNSKWLRWGVLRLLHFGAAGLVAGSLMAVPILPRAENTFSYRDSLPTLENSSSTSKGTSKDSADWKGRLPISDLTEDEAITHALDRLGYGARPGDIERIRKLGLEKWIIGQLRPETLNDKPAENRLADYPTLTMSATTLVNEYPQPNVAAKRLGITPEEYNKRVQDSLHPPQGERAAPDKRPQVILSELTMAKLTRAIYSERQLQEQLTDFWFNHFNIFANKDQDIFLVGVYERDAIRPHTLGKFRDMLGATAHSPAMLIYLDNWLSADPAAIERAKHATPEQKRAWKDLPGYGNKRGLNENYGRELMELHTLGVDGGYTQRDVIAVAKCFTGWTVRDPQNKPEFVFDPRIHDAALKVVLGKKIKDGGERDGEKVLDLLVAQKATAHHLSYELAEHFVSDAPPPALVDRMVKTFQKTKGDLRETMRTMIYSPEFWSRASYRAKIKTPFELVASAARALGADVDAPTPLVGWVDRIGEPLYRCQPPTGYKDDAATWVNTGALLSRLNFALTLATNKVRGASVDLTSRLGEDVGGDPARAMDRAVDVFLGGQISAASRATLEKDSSDPKMLNAKLGEPVRPNPALQNSAQQNAVRNASPAMDIGVMTGLVLGTPEFQRR
jgi:uncharacterized protein (DUF1800 family)